MGLAVVYDRLFISVEGQCTQLVGDLFRQTERIGEKAEVEFDGEDKVGVDDTWAGLYKSDDNTERRRGNKTERERKNISIKFSANCVLSPSMQKLLFRSTRGC